MGHEYKARYEVLSRAINCSSIAFCIIDSQATHLKYVNKPFRELLGFVCETRTIPTLEEYFVNIQRLGISTPGAVFEDFQRKLREHYSHGEKIHITRQIKDGRYFRLEICPEDDEDIVVTYTNVTDLERAVRDAKKAEVAKSEFMANMSHEIRTPMNGVLGMAQILSNTQLTDHQEKCLNVISRSGNALITIINDILDFSKIEAGQLEICQEPFVLREAVEDVMSLLAHSARKKGVELIVDITTNVPHQFMGDMGRLRQILINLVGNAIKFTAAGYVKLAVRGEAGNDAYQLTFDVEDTGIGIEADKVGRIFNQFEQADSSTTRKFGGTGLGLTISRCLVEAMDGTIQVVSELDKGSTFTFCIALPLVQSSGSPKVEYRTLGNIPILIVDDLAVNRTVIADQVSQMGARAYAVPSAQAALDLMKKAAIKGHRFPAIISDFQMPGMDGLEFVRAVRADKTIAQTPIMILSSVDLSPHKMALKSLGVKHAITKPATVKDIHQVLTKIIDPSAMALRRASRQIQSPQTAKPDTLTASTIRILAADDDEVNRLVIAGMLKRPGIDLTIVQDGQEALDAFSLNAYDVILMDVDMPIMDGLTAVRHIRSLENKGTFEPIPIIATTAHVMEHDREHFLKAGMDDYLPKPIQEDDLLSAIKKWVRPRPLQSVDAA